MKRLSLLWILILSVSKISFSQETRYVVNAGEEVDDVIPATEIFQYGEFTDGRVFFRDGVISQGRMNYSRLMDEMLFISGKGDTLALKDEATISFICIANDTFYFDHGYILVVKNTPGLKVGIKPCFRFVDKAKVAAYDRMSSTSSVTSLASLDDGTRTHPLEVKELSTLIKDTLYYLGDRYNHFVPATKKHFIDFFPDCGKQLNKFCKKNNIDFEDNNDLERLIDYAEQVCFSM